ncbi:MAG TPA: type I asparaginase [Pyrinomonadaceae bacterium]|nr:type I asparaginase [Pyrinomonadaceae bacterium]
MKKRIHVYYTGGTVGMTRDAGGRYVPDADFLPAAMRAMPELDWRDPHNPLMPEWDIRVRERLLDSTDMTPRDWAEIALYIRGRYDAYDGFVVLHGTDTMAYTASALSFMFEGLRKPIILTGSQVPLAEVRNDARENLITSLIIAGNYGLPRPEVCLYFGRKLLRGCRAVKTSADGFAAFESPNFPALAAVGVDIEYNTNVSPPPAGDGTDAAVLGVQEFSEMTIGALRIFPGINGAMVRALLQSEPKGLVLEAYGAGNVPGGAGYEDFMDALREAVERRVVIVDCTQCLRGGVRIDLYATGPGRVGVVSGADMTAEAALTKLFYLFSRPEATPAAVRRELQRNLRGELTPREDDGGSPDGVM